MTDKILNLDELFGVARPIVAVLEGRRYYLRRPEAFGPRDIQRLEFMRSRISELQRLQAQIADGRELTDAEDEELRDLTARQIRLICPELAKANLPFLQQVLVLQHYFAAIQEEQQAKKVETAPSASIGDGSTPGSPSGTDLPPAA